MPRISIVTPARPGTRNGNLHTAARWAGMLRGAGFDCRVALSWQGGKCDALLALHARRSHDSIVRFAGPRIVALTGTDLYADLPGSAEARRSLRLADRLIVLQEDALRRLPAGMRAKAHVVYQSSDTKLRHVPPRGRFRIVVVGHLREVKDPFRAALALELVNDDAIELVHIGAALDAAHERTARAWMRREPRYRWLGSLPHGRALRWIAASHVLVVSSRMEGGANVIAEAARIGVPVLASRMSGNLGMLGASWPAYFRTGDHEALAALMARSRDHAFYRTLKAAMRGRRRLFAPAEERRALLGAVRAALRQASP